MRGNGTQRKMGKRLNLIITTLILFILMDAFIMSGVVALDPSPFTVIANNILVGLYAFLFAVIIIGY